MITQHIIELLLDIGLPSAIDLHLAVNLKLVMKDLLGLVHNTLLCIGIELRPTRLHLLLPSLSHLL